MRSVALVLCTLTTLLVLPSPPRPPPRRPAAPASTAASASVIRAINRARASHGLRRLRAGRRLARAADAHTRNMLRADFFAHGAFVAARAPLRALPPHRRDDRHDLALLRPRRRADVAELPAPPRRAALAAASAASASAAALGRLGSSRACLVTADFASRR